LAQKCAIASLSLHGDDDPAHAAAYDFRRENSASGDFFAVVPAGFDAQILAHVLHK